MPRTGKEPYGYCDRTGFRYPLKDLVPQYINRKPSGLLVGRDVLDEDHPQHRVGEADSSDEQSLDDPRPDVNLNESRALWAWDPVGGGLTEMGSRTVGLEMEACAGNVKVTT